MPSAKTILEGLDQLDPTSVAEQVAPMAHEHVRRFEADRTNEQLLRKATAETRDVALEVEFFERFIGPLVDGDEETVGDAVWRLLKAAADDVRQGKDMTIDAALGEAIRLERIRDGDRCDLVRLLGLRDSAIARANPRELVRHRDQLLDAAAELLERLKKARAGA